MLEILSTEFSEEDAQECLDNFVMTLSLYLRKMISLVVMKSFIARQKCNKKQSTTGAASMLGFHKNCWEIHEMFIENKGELPESKQGKYR